MIKTIDEIIPDQIAQFHTQLINDFIETGASPIVEK